MEDDRNSSSRAYFLTGTATDNGPDSRFQAASVKMLGDSFVCTLNTRMVKDFMVPSNDAVDESSRYDYHSFVKDKIWSMNICDGIVW